MEGKSVCVADILLNLETEEQKTNKILRYLQNDSKYDGYNDAVPEIDHDEAILLVNLITTASFQVTVMPTTILVLIVMNIRRHKIVILEIMILGNHWPKEQSSVRQELVTFGKCWFV